MPLVNEASMPARTTWTQMSLIRFRFHSQSSGLKHHTEGSGIRLRFQSLWLKPPVEGVGGRHHCGQCNAADTLHRRPGKPGPRCTGSEILGMIRIVDDVRRLSAIKLIRTDTTLDLSREAGSVWSSGAVASLW